MYNHSSGNSTGSNSSKLIGKFVLSQFNSGNKGEEQKKTVSYLLTLLTSIAIYLPLASLTEILDASIEQMKLNSTFIRTQGYVLFSSIFSYSPNPLNQIIVA